MVTLGPKNSLVETLENKLAHDRAELVERLVNSGLTQAQAENVTGACAAHVWVARGVETIRRH
jgi:hypothetical protein